MNLIERISHLHRLDELKFKGTVRDLNDRLSKIFEDIDTSELTKILNPHLYLTGLESKKLLFSHSEDVRLDPLDIDNYLRVKSFERNIEEYSTKLILSDNSIVDLTKSDFYNWDISYDYRIKMLIRL